MSDIQWFFLFAVFGAVFGVSLLLLLRVAGNPARLRLRQLERGARPAAEEDVAWVEKVAPVVQPLARLSLPSEGWEKSPLRVRFLNAGWRNPAAPAVYFGAKTLLATLLPVMVMLLLPKTVQFGSVMTFGVLLSCAAFGYYLPNGVLAHMVEKRQREVVESFPDALDLLTVCVEAGLSVDQALAKVADEMHMRSQALADELHLVLLELRAGFSRERALRNLGLRSGVEQVDMLVTMLIQADRFGTSVADSLRVHADTLRTRRRLEAEEAAAKISLKLLFPLIFFIFPSLLVVLMGPAFIQIYRVLLPTMAGAGS